MELRDKLRIEYPYGRTQDSAIRRRWGATPLPNRPKVTDNEGKTTLYEYQNQGGESQMITKIADKAGAVTNLAWYFADDAGGAWGAYKIEVTDPSGLKTVYDRSVATSVDTVTPKDGATALAKSVYTKVFIQNSRAPRSGGFKHACNSM